MTREEQIRVKRRAQPIRELQRKAHKAARRGWWTQEDLDYLHSDSKEDLWPDLQFD